MRISLWIVQGVLAALFLFAGIMKLTMPVEVMTAGSALPGWFFRFIGVAETAGAAGLVLPCLLRIRPGLTPLAAAGLAFIMAGATVISLPMGAVALFPLLTGALAGFVAWGRWWRAPVTAKPRSCWRAPRLTTSQRHA